MSKTGYSMATIDEFVGRELGVSEWVVVDQARIDAFAHCTGDTQWIHMNEERAKREGPFGGTIAHGYLTLSLLATLAIEVGIIPADASAALNYGLDKVRFMAPVRSGSRVRSRVMLTDVERKGGGRIIVRADNALQVEGEEKPALIAQTLVMILA
ncbi:MULTISPECIES: MaoC family dehydratase [Caballeronia]|uniref:MaoC family dehydratase n=1 Tax=Caballeronia jiangsuensis TaxID=1458357 RepID=A0ABW9CHI0_9BURK|nr:MULTISPECIES: MaoC family dehydratase [unclassified Caballeronia]KAK48684.1 nodulation protein NodN [Caballeronia jiangsuensis]MDR5744854.1 MaoC family dehydratase [Caballeronia sp. LZ029]